MKRSYALTLASTLAVAAVFAGSASASSSKHPGRMATPHASLLSFSGEGDDGGALPGGRIAHGTIGGTAPSAGAALNLRALGGDDGSESDDGGALPGGRVAHGTIGKASPTANAAAHLRALGGNDGGNDR